MTGPQIAIAIAVPITGAVLILLWHTRRDARRTTETGSQAAAVLTTWAAARGWRQVAPPPEPAVAQRVAVRSLVPLAAAAGQLDGLPAQLSLWSCAQSHLGSPITFRSVVSVAAVRLRWSTGPEPFGMGSLNAGTKSPTGLLLAHETATLVTLPRVLATRRSVHPWGLTRIPIWPTATLPADPQRWSATAAELDRLGAFLLVEGAQLSVSAPATAAPPDALLTLLRRAMSAVGDALGHSGHGR